MSKMSETDVDAEQIEEKFTVNGASSTDISRRNVIYIGACSARL